MAAGEVFIPKLGQTVEEVTLVAWMVEDGANVDIGQPVLEVETDKAVFPIECGSAGFIHRGPYRVGEVVPVLTVVATIGKQQENFAPSSPVSSAGLASGREPDPARDTAPEPGPAPAAEDAAEPSGRRCISPRARRLARRKRVDLSRITPTGGGGRRIVEQDVLAYLDRLPRTTPLAAAMASQAGVEVHGITGTGLRGAITKVDVERTLAARTAPRIQPAGSPAPTGRDISKTLPIRGVREVILHRMAESARTTARVTLFQDVDATELVTVRQVLKDKVGREWGFTPGYNDLFVFIAAGALREHPHMNARLNPEGTAIEWLSRIHLGVAVDTDRGLLVPVIRDADRKGLRAIGEELHIMVERARANRSKPEDLNGGTFTITNLGRYGIDAFTPVINPPEAAILGVGRIAPRPVYVGENLVRREILTLSLAFDHRLVDGAPAARFLQRIRQGVEDPVGLLAAIGQECG